MRTIIVADAQRRVHTRRLQRIIVLFEHGFRYSRTAWPKMTGQDTFIIVAFMCKQKTMCLFLRLFDLLGQKLGPALWPDIILVVDGQCGGAHASFNTGSRSRSADVPRFIAARLARSVSVRDFSFEKKSPPTGGHFCFVCPDHSAHRNGIRHGVFLTAWLRDGQITLAQNRGTAGP